MSKYAMPENIHTTLAEGKRCGGLMVSAIDSGVSGLGSSPGQGHCYVLGQETLLSQSRKFNAGGNPTMD